MIENSANDEDGDRPSPSLRKCSCNAATHFVCLACHISVPLFAPCFSIHFINVKVCCLFLYNSFAFLNAWAGVQSHNTSLINVYVVCACRFSGFGMCVVQSITSTLGNASCMKHHL